MEAIVTTPANTLIPSSPSETAPAAPGETFVGLSEAEMAKYQAMTPEQLTELPIETRLQIYNTLKQGDKSRQSFEEFSNEYYSINTANTQHGKPSVAPPPQSINSSPEDILEYVAMDRRYASAFPDTPAGAGGNNSWTREQVLTLQLLSGTVSSAYPWWDSFFSKLPDSTATGHLVALDSSMPLAGKVESASEIMHFTSTKMPYRVINGTTIAFSEETGNWITD